MSNYQMCQAVKLNINGGTNQWRLPAGDLFWDHLVDFMHCKYDPGETHHALANDRQLPAFLCPDTGDLISRETEPWSLGRHQVTGHIAVSGDYWICSFAYCEYFWQELWRAGNRGRIVFEFQAEVGDDTCYLPGDGGGFYVVTVDLEDAGPTSVTHDDNPAFYEQVLAQRDAAAKEALEDAGVETEEELDYFQWFARDSVTPYCMYERYDLLTFAEQGFAVMSEGFYTT